MNELIQALEKIRELSAKLTELVEVADIDSGALKLVQQIDDTAFFAIQKGKKL